MKNKFLISYILLFVLSSITAVIAAQETITISGLITDEMTKKPVSYTRVFVEGTTYHTISNKEGIYSLALPENFRDQITVTNMLYVPQNSKIFWDTISTTNTTWNFILKEKEITLDEVVITERREKIPEYIEKRFWGILLEEDLKGNVAKSIRTQHLKVENKEDAILTLNRDKTILTVHSDNPIRIYNKYLGYTIHYHIEDFKWDIPSNLVYRKGKSYFEEEIPKNNRNKKTWEKNRLTSYLSSMLHLKHLLYNGNYKESHFQAYRIIENKDSMEVIRKSNLSLSSKDFPKYAISTLEKFYFLQEINWAKINFAKYYLFETTPLNLSEYVVFDGNKRTIHFPHNLLIIYNPSYENTPYKEFQYTYPDSFANRKEHKNFQWHHPNTIQKRQIYYLITNKETTTLYPDYTIFPIDGFYYHKNKYYGIKYFLPRDYVPENIENNIFNK